MSTEPSMDVQPGRLKYVFSGATVQGLRSRSLLKSEGRYYLKISLEGEEGWSTRELRTRESALVWDRAVDRHEFEQATTSVLQVTLCKHHSWRPTEIGTAQLPISTWLTTGAPLVRIGANKATRVIYVTLNLSKIAEDAPRATVDTTTQQPLHEVEAEASGLPQSPAADAVATAHDARYQAVDNAMNMASEWETLLNGLDAFARETESMREVHPFSKMAAKTVSAAYKVVLGNQEEHDANVRQLVHKMRTVYEFLLDTKDLQSDKTRERVLSRLSMQTVECGKFISTFATTSSPFRRALLRRAYDVAAKVDEYMKSFDELLDDFRTGTQLRTEIAAVRMLTDIKDLATDMDIREIPYAAGAGYAASKCCLPETRLALLDRITSWANTDGTDASRICLLVGPAGTGKSTIAHTIASRFLQLKQIGSVFCFSTREAATRTPQSLFRNMARDLCDGWAEFKSALHQAIGGRTSLYTTTDLDTLFDNFILGPASAVTVNGSIIFIIDALDESGTRDGRQKLLWMLSKRLKELPPTFRFLITARAEQDIQESFLASNSEVIIQRMPTPEEDLDLSDGVLRYVRHTLSQPNDRLPTGLSAECCETLATKAEGLFQWAAVACGHIMAPLRLRESAWGRYLAVTRRDYSSLQSLYKDVLQQVVPQDTETLKSFRDIMGFVLTAVDPLCMSSLHALMSYLNPGEDLHIYDSLPFLGSLLSGVGDPTVAVRPLHSSFTEMLQSSECGGAFYIGCSGHHERWTTACLRLLNTQLRFNMAGLTTSYRLNRDIDTHDRLHGTISEELRYACKHWGHHLVLCRDGFEREVADSLRALFCGNFLFWLEAASLTETIGHVPLCLASAMERLETIGDPVRQLAQDGLKFVRAFTRPIQDSAAHIYISALIWAPAQSGISEAYRGRYPRTAMPVHSGGLTWPSCTHILRGHASGVTCAVFSSNGTRIVSGYGDGTVRIWDAETGHAIGEPLVGHEEMVSSVALSSDGTRIVSGSGDKTVRVWDGVGILNTDVPDWRSTFTLSPDRRHQLRAAYDPAGGEPAHIKFDFDTGWIIANETDHLLWVPPGRMRRLCTGQCKLIIPTETMVTIDLSRFVQGNRWTECCLSLP